MDTKTSMYVARTLLNARETKGWTQEHVAGCADVSVKTVRRAEQTGTVSNESLMAMCSVLGLDAGEMREASVRVSTSIPGTRIALPVNRQAGIEKSDLGIFPHIMSYVLVGLLMLMHHETVHRLDPYPREISIWLVATILVPPICLVVGIFAIVVERPRMPRTWIERGMDVIPWAGVLASSLCLLAYSCNYLYAVCIAPYPVALAVQLFFAHFGGKSSAARERREQAVNLHAFVFRMPKIIAEMRSTLGRPVGAAEVTVFRALVEEAVTLAAAVGRVERLTPFVYLVEDVERGISSRKALHDYIDVVAATYNPVDPQPRLWKDFDKATARLEERVSIFA